MTRFLTLAISMFMLLTPNGWAAQWGPKNIIVMISDGGGYNHLDAASIYQHGRTGALVYYQFPIQYGMSTYMAGGSYDPGRAWSQFDYVNAGYTDSAAAATTLATGFKTYNGSIGMDTNQQPLKNIRERAEELGKATGVVTSVQFSHATPAGFVAHNISRQNYEPIAQEMLLDSTVDVIMGCGHPLFNDNGHPATNTYQYVGGKSVWDGLVAGAMDFDLNGDGVMENSVEDADGDGIADAWTLIQERSEFRALMSGPTSKRVIGVPQVHTTLQVRRSSAVFNPNVPTLEEMTRAALNVLDDAPAGFFLMVEGGAVDWASHSNASLRMIEEEIDFSNSVAAVVEWVELKSRWDETLLIVTGDHETGYLTGPGSGGFNWAPLVNHGTGVLPGMEWHSVNHTNSLIPFFAKGVGADLFVRYADESDPVRGAYLDNAEVGLALFQLIELPLATGVAVTPRGRRAMTWGEVKQTALLQNYPNPFNPETWIPYQLTHDADVTITIYNVSGHRVRTLALGHQSTGPYLTKQRAAYWDGRSETGEWVSSGVYFYHLQAGAFGATRRLFILK